MDWRLPNPQCPKCGREMAGPSYDRLHDRLNYQCLCGYNTSTPPLDRLRTLRVEAAKAALAITRASRR